MTPTIDEILLAAHDGHVPFEWAVAYASDGNLQRAVDGAWAACAEPARLVHLWERDRAGWKRMVYRVAGALGALALSRDGAASDSALREVFERAVTKGRPKGPLDRPRVAPHWEYAAFARWDAWNALDSSPQAATNYVFVAVDKLQRGRDGFADTQIADAIRRVPPPRAAAIGLVLGGSQ